MSCDHLTKGAKAQRETRLTTATKDGVACGGLISVKTASNKGADVSRSVLSSTTLKIDGYSTDSLYFSTSF